MHIRPRCRQWLPLASQQLRLRSLIRIQGCNIECTNSNSSIYYTLHETQQSEELYRSEPLPARQKLLKWAEIACLEMLKANLNSVCVKVWEKFECIDMVNSKRNLQPIYVLANEGTAYKEQKNSPFQKRLPNSSCLKQSGPLPCQLDKLLFMWAVYFSGLVPIRQEIEPAHYFPNSLVFQLHGEYFASAEHCIPDSLVHHPNLNYKKHNSAVPRAGIFSSNDVLLISPEDRKSSRSSFDAQLNDEAEGDSLSISNVRYKNLRRLRAEARYSYDLRKLLEIQELQRLLKKKSREVIDICSEIKQRCVRCITTEQITCKKRVTSTSATSVHHQHSMGRALSLLLSEQEEQHDPQTLLKVQQLQKLIESIRNKRGLLQTECDTYNKRISDLQLRLSILSDARRQMQTSLQERRKKLSREKNELEETRHWLELQLQAKRNVSQNVKRRMSSLCMELRDIYPIRSICGISYNHMDAYLNEVRCGGAQAANITPIAVSASLGYVAHLVQMIAAIFCKPLRNPIQHEGSRTRIVDIVQDHPYTSREFPLYTRSTILSKHVKYAIHLLNQNISQLHYDITGGRRDLRATIENILFIFLALSKVEQSEAANANQRTIYTSPESHSSLDLNSNAGPNSYQITAMVHSNKPILIAASHLSGQSFVRVCRSVGSYSDCEDDFKDIIVHCYSNSDSNIRSQKLAK